MARMPNRRGLKTSKLILTKIIFSMIAIWVTLTCNSPHIWWANLRFYSHKFLWCHYLTFNNKVNNWIKWDNFCPNSFQIKFRSSSNTLINTPSQTYFNHQLPLCQSISATKPISTFTLLNNFSKVLWIKKAYCREWFRYWRRSAWAVFKMLLISLPNPRCKQTSLIWTNWINKS